MTMTREDLWEYRLIEAEEQLRALHAWVRVPPRLRPLYRSEARAALAYLSTLIALLANADLLEG